jgi:large subunit ribosomal protein L17
MSPSLLPKVFDTLATRYRNRPGGYTRIYKYGHRPGDNAPKAILELVDGPRDTKFEMAARKVGWEVLGWKERGKHTKLYQGIERGVETIDVLGGNASYLRERTRIDVMKVLRNRPGSERATFGKKAADYLVCVTSHV